MIKLLDYYYLVLLRYTDWVYGKDISSYHVPGIVGFTLTLNLFSFVVLINRLFIDNGYFWITIGIIGILGIIAIDIFYNKRRRARLREQYKDESSASRQRGVVFVVLYVILSIAFLILSIWIAG
jgi:hypothetical protein